MDWTGAAAAFGSPAEPVTTLLDTHFILWIALRSKRLRAYPWIDHYSPWTVSPVVASERTPHAPDREGPALFPGRREFLKGLGRLPDRDARGCRRGRPHRS